MTLRHLKIFVTVCETGSATAAGRSYILRNLLLVLRYQSLKIIMGLKLFDRIAKRLHITEVGKSFLQYAAHMWDFLRIWKRKSKTLM
jgi:DNA-binding transcriptional LysR family regulator